MGILSTDGKQRLIPFLKLPLSDLPPVFFLSLAGLA
ncbi:MAG: hypothetical protein ACJAZ1_000358 [Yoonia sp.]